jgi:hypothetical protein
MLAQRQDRWLVLCMLSSAAWLVVVGCSFDESKLRGPASDGEAERWDGGRSGVQVEAGGGRWEDGGIDVGSSRDGADLVEASADIGFADLVSDAIGPDRTVGAEAGTSSEASSGNEEASGGNEDGPGAGVLDGSDELAGAGPDADSGAATADSGAASRRPQAMLPGTGISSPRPTRRRRPRR